MNSRTLGVMVALALAAMIMLTVLLDFITAHATPIIIEDVPAYYWTDGCTPTAASMILGYWDLNGYDGIFEASGDDVFDRGKVRHEISNKEYWYTDRPITSVAGFMKTSTGKLSYGATWLHNVIPGLEDFGDYKGVDIEAERVTTSWDYYTNQIDASKPVLLTVDTKGRGVLNHSVAGIGYEDRGEEGLWYAAYNTYGDAEIPKWYEFRPISRGNVYGLDRTMFTIGMGIVEEPSPVPEPTTALLFGVGLLGITSIRRRKVCGNSTKEKV